MNSGGLVGMRKTVILRWNAIDGSRRRSIIIDHDRGLDQWLKEKLNV
jgi:hypothetical protein